MGIKLGTFANKGGIVNCLCRQAGQLNHGREASYEGT